MARLIVRIERSHEPLLIGSEAEIVGFDYVPFCEASKKNPNLDLKILASGYLTHSPMTDVSFVRKEES